MPSERFDLPLRIVVADPLPGLAIALQRGKAAKAALAPPASRSAQAVAFDLEVTVDGRLPDGRPRLLGAYVQGPPEARFAYLSVGRYAGQADSEWAGRVKVPLGGIGLEAIAALAPGARLVAHIAGRSPRGGPALASVQLLPPGWT
ncbi:DUF5990 family protein [Phenylobacterium sp.]|uniref:DUF5990 family protein n=1 Tax=Phenylobacterium sp. TaxID=1871053 RepID=UPI00120A9758|nr:DUF5990 family protein [Phenylobacterium sp.]THD61529.1 MAG: hypothetical protein E8A49_11145 [Phenylobacterium sp.]